MVIQTRYLVQEFKTGISSVLMHFFDGASHVVNTIPTVFPACRLYLNIRELEEDITYTNPIIAIVGEGVGGSEWSRRGGTKSIDYKCKAVTGIVMTRFTNVRQTVYVKVRRILPLIDHNGNNVNSDAFADSAWSLLGLIFKTQSTRFESYGLRILQFDDAPIDVSNEQETLLLGTLHIEINTVYYKE